MAAGVMDKESELYQHIMCGHTLKLHHCYKKDHTEQGELGSYKGILTRPIRFSRTDCVIQSDNPHTQPYTHKTKAQGSKVAKPGPTMLGWNVCGSEKLYSTSNRDASSLHATAQGIAYG